MSVQTMDSCGYVPPSVGESMGCADMTTVAERAQQTAASENSCK